MYRITYFTFIILIGYCNSIDAQGRLIKEFNYSFSCLTDIHVDGLNMYAALEDNKIQLFEFQSFTQISYKN